MGEIDHSAAHVCGFETCGANLLSRMPRNQRNAKDDGFADGASRSYEALSAFTLHFFNDCQGVSQLETHIDDLSELNCPECCNKVAILVKNASRPRDELGGLALEDCMFMDSKATVNERKVAKPSRAVNRKGGRTQQKLDGHRKR